MSTYSSRQPRRTPLDTELTAVIGAERHERTDTRSDHRNGARYRLLSTPAGDLEVRTGIPKLRVGSFFLSLLEPRRRVDRALWAVIMTACINVDVDSEGRRAGQRPGL